MNNSVTAVLGMKLNDNMSIGLMPSAEAVSQPYLTPAIVYAGALTLGFNFGTDNFNIGLSVDGANKFNGFKNYGLGVNIPGGITLGDGAQIRFFNKFSGSRENKPPEHPDPFNYFGGQFIGDIAADNRTGVSYVNDFSGIKYFIEINNDWNIYTYYNHVVTVVPVIYKDEAAWQGDEVSLHLGFEARLLTDWLKARVGFTPAHYLYSDYYRHIMSGLSDNNSREVRNEADFLNLYQASLGFGIDLSDGMKLDISFSNSGLYTGGGTYFYASNNIPANWKNGGNASTVSLEFTMKW
jgi:hypothetical protein